MTNETQLDILQKRDELHEEIAQLEKEINLLNLFLIKAQNEYFEIDSIINENQQIHRLKIVNSR
jgi:hypothetical protein